MPAGVCSQLTYETYLVLRGVSVKEMAVICSQRCYWVTDLYIDQWTGWIYTVSGWIAAPTSPWNSLWCVIVALCL